MRHNFVCFNGPLGAGKSWVCDRLNEHYSNVNIVRVSWQDCLANAAMALLAVDPRLTPYAVFKTTEYMGKTGRQWMIDMSENFAKQHDEYFFSIVLAETIRRIGNRPLPGHSRNHKTLFVADSNGFESELDYMRSQDDINVLACSIEPPEYHGKRGLPWIAGDSRYNLAHKASVVTGDSNQMLVAAKSALERRGWV